jgi:hypothetical protein
MLIITKIILVVIGAVIGGFVGVVLFHTQKHPFGFSGAPSISAVGGMEDWRTKWGILVGSFIGAGSVILLVSKSDRH